MAKRPPAIDLQTELTSAELNAMKSLVQQYPRSGKHMEIDTAAGGTLRELKLCYPKSRPPFVVVDPFTYFPDQLEIVKITFVVPISIPNMLIFEKISAGRSLKWQCRPMKHLISYLSMATMTPVM